MTRLLLISTDCRVKNPLIMEDVTDKLGRVARDEAIDDGGSLAHALILLSQPALSLASFLLLPQRLTHPRSSPRQPAVRKLASSSIPRDRAWPNHYGYSQPNNQATRGSVDECSH